MATPVTPQTLYADRLESAIGILLLIHDREGHVRALDFTTSSHACGVFFGSIMERREMTSL